MRWLGVAVDLELQELVGTAGLVQLKAQELRRKLHVVELAEVLGQRRVGSAGPATCWNCLSRNAYG
eukprot:16395285-Heterocapsa_arctica.AAC.1